MKLIFVLLALLLSISAFAQIERAPVKHVYVPQGFDANDVIEVIVTGTLPTPCYGRHNTIVKISGRWIQIEVMANRREGQRPCPEMIVPFHEVISVGNLPAGNYNVTVNGILLESLEVKNVIIPGKDDYLYAAIDRIESVGGSDFILHGWRYSNCVVANNIKVISNGKDTFSILPIMQQVSDFCPMKMMPVAFPLRLNLSGLKTKYPLLHVRTMDGKSFNTVLSLDRR